MNIVTIHGLNKKFGKIPVLKGVNLAIEEGEIFGILGVNGAGKTTLIRCLLGLTKADKGSLLFRDRPLDIKDIQDKVGFLPENFSPPRNLKAGEFLEILRWGNKYKCDVFSLLKIVGLWGHRGKYIRMYSRGMLQRLGVALALLKNPEIIILDEPTLGLDPVGQRELLDLLYTLNNKDKKTIFFSSHIIYQMEQLCRRIAILHHGKIKFTGSIEEITKKHNVPSLEDAFLKEIDCYV